MKSLLLFKLALLVPVFVSLFLLTSSAASAPMPSGVRTGVRGLARQRALAGGGPWCRIEPLVRWLGMRVHGLMSTQLLASLDRQVRMAGSYLGLLAEELVALSVVCAAAALTAGALANLVVKIGPVFVVAVGAFGAVAPFLTVSSFAGERSKAIGRRLPSAIDLLALSMSAGLDFPNALREARVAPARSTTLGPVMIAKLLVVAGLVGAIVKVSVMGPDAPSTSSPPMPELFAKISTDCPRKDLAEARTIADDQRAIADGARDRSPFDPRGSRAAVKGYEIAAACYRITHQVEAGEIAAQAALRMREETTLDFRARRVRLDRVLLVNDYDLAAQDVAVLSALTEGQQGEYSRWLAGIAQDLKNRNTVEHGK